MISVYSSTEKVFANNGIKNLKPLKAKIRKEDNGDYYIDLKDTLDKLSYYQEGMIVRVLTPWGYQSFRLTNPNIENNNIIVKGYHLYFDRKNYIIKDSYVVKKDCNEALNHLNDATDIHSPFTVSSDITLINSYRCVRKSLQEADSDLIERWGGHLYRDNFKVSIRSKIGEDRGIVISYAKNLKTIKATENWDDVVTKILPVGKDGLTLPEVYLELEEKIYDIPYTKVVSFDQNEITEDDFKNEEGEINTENYENALIENLRKKALAYLEENKLPKVNYEVDAYIKDVSDIGDTIYVRHPKCNIDLTTNVIAIEYDCILQKYIKIEFGNFKNSLKNLIKDITSAAKEEVKNVTNETKLLLENELRKATADIWSTLGNSYVIYDGDKILIVDKLPKEEAKNVIMINNGGIGFSQTGINGTFNSAWTIDGTLNMQNINVINLIADMIKGGTLKLGGLDNGNGIVEIYDASGELIGKIDNNGFSFLFRGTETNFNDFVDTVNFFSTDLELYNLTIPIDENNNPLESKEYIVNHYSYFKGQQVKVIPTTLIIPDGLSVSLTNTNIEITTNNTIAIPNVNNELSLTFEYIDGENKHYTYKKILITLVQKGLDGKDGEKGEPGPQGLQGKQGEKGEQGLPGADGTSTYFYIKYSENATGNPMTDTPNDKTQYMGVASTTSATAPTSYSAYTWSKIKGNDGANGTPGQSGADGKTSYLHIKYSNDGTTFTDNEGEDVGRYQGTYADFTKEDSTNFDDYKWVDTAIVVEEELKDLDNKIEDTNHKLTNDYSTTKELEEKIEEAKNSTIIEMQTMITQTKDEWEASVIQKINNNGIENLKNTLVTININGIQVATNLSRISTLITNNTFAIQDNTGNYLAYFGYDEVEKRSKAQMDNLTIDNYFTAGYHRVEKFEDAGEKRTGYFYNG